MKFLISLCFLCYVNADPLNKIVPGSPVLSLLEWTGTLGSNNKALSTDEEWVEQAGDDIRQILKKQFDGAINELLEGNKDDSNDGKQMDQQFLGKDDEVIEKMEDLRIENHEDNKQQTEGLDNEAKQIIDRVLGRLGFGEHISENQIEVLSRSKVDELLEIVITKITADEIIQNIRKYINRIGSNSELAQELKTFIEKLRDTEIKEIIRGLFSNKFRTSREIKQKSAQSGTPEPSKQSGDIFGKAKDFFKKLEVKFNETSEDFEEWMKSKWDEKDDEMKEQKGSAKTIAIEYMDKGKDAGAEVARGALEFFEKNKDELEDLYERAVEAARDALKDS